MEINQSMRNMVSKWYEQNEQNKKQGNGALTPSKIYVGTPKAEIDIMRTISISGILDKNGEDHFQRMNSQIKEFDNFQKQIYPHLEPDDDSKIDSAEKKKQAPDNPRSLYSLKGS